jgi:hypothetical protein
MGNYDKRLTIETDEELKRKFKSAVCRKGSTLKETLEAFMTAYIDNVYDPLLHS